MSTKLRLFESTVARRIFTAFFAASLLPVGVAALLVLSQVSDSLEGQARVQLGDVVRNSGQQLLDRLLAADAVLGYLPGHDTVQAPAQFDAALLQARDGSQRPLFGELSAVPELEIPEEKSKLLLRKVGAEQEILLARVVGDIVGRLSPEYLWGLAELTPYGVDLCVLAPSRQSLFCTAELPSSAAETVRRTVAASSSGSLDWEQDGTVWLASHWELFLPSRFEAQPWTILVSQRKTIALESMSAFNRVFPQAVAMSLVLILLISLSQIRRILRPLSQLVGGTRKIAERNFARPFSLQSDDEFGALGEAMNDMAERLGRQFSTLTALAEIDRLILSSHDTERVLDAVLDRIADVVSGCDISVLLIDPGQQERGRLYSRSDAVRIEQELVRCTISKELRAWLTQQADGGLHDVGEICSRLPAYPQKTRGGAVFVIPILHGEQLQGALVACFASRDEVAAADLESLKEFASRCAVAISAAEREQKLVHRAHFDPLTGLPNRQLCHDRLRQALAAARREEHKVAVLFIDLDGFKHVNDSLGHSNGDELLRETALRLSAALRDTDTVARLGGDEYVVILPRVHGALEVEVIVSNIMDTMKWPFSIDGQAAFVSASVGVAMFPDDALTTEELLRKADTAMYGAKDAGRARYVFFAKEMDERVHERLALQTDLRSALTQGELFLVYQPQVDLASGEVVCAEALLRWKHPKRGLVPVELFLPVLEETGLVESIGSWVLQTALAEFARWRQRGLSVRRVAVNTTTRQLFHAGLVDLIDECLQLSELPGSALEIELTETSLVTDFVRSDNILRSLAERGVRIAIDDFGTGYSSLGYLKDLTFDMVKIDRAFISGLPDEKSLAIVKAVLGMAHSLGKRVVAEGIEAETQRLQLTELGCDIGQGFLLGRPLTGPEFMAWLDSIEASNLLEQAFALNA